MSCASYIFTVIVGFEIQQKFFHVYFISRFNYCLPRRVIKVLKSAKESSKKSS